MENQILRLRLHFHIRRRSTFRHRRLLLRCSCKHWLRYIRQFQSCRRFRLHLHRSSIRHRSHTHRLGRCSFHRLCLRCSCMMLGRGIPRFQTRRRFHRRRRHSSTLRRSRNRLRVRCTLRGLSRVLDLRSYTLQG